MKRIFVTVMCSLTFIKTHSQIENKNVALFDYKMNLWSKEAGLNKMRFNVNYVFFDKTSPLSVGFNANLYDFYYDVNNVDYAGNTSQISNIYSFTINFLKTLHISEKLNIVLGFSPQAVSNFNTDVTTNDINLNFTGYFEKKWTNVNSFSKLAVGAEYGYRLGKLKWLPVLYYYKEFNENIDITFGFPKTQITYRFNDRNSLKLNVYEDSFYANIHYKYLGDQNYKSYKMTYLNFSAGLNYELSFGNNWFATSAVDYSIYNDLEIIDNHEFNMGNVASLTFGMKYKF
ncbi:DUF6268 family outer membrane beta-barrel protein [Abyssalbus ytuae]|uniref:DUF6268 family outer membrane beta-barrel protein n=1 Tax=Abyssalbus ytuae TaxID=2926907 RepID=A0A9E7CTV4_9FLAO|nr:DUF6268 family outer membrane beta-barrel protein [Abyssalbus ytuae]UOB18776.1 DUF6268 family outer membrane beta-barrel protein [Abyssalbus ytuae]